MNNNEQPPFPGLGTIALGSLVFLWNTASTLPSLIQAVSRTVSQQIPHGTMNASQRKLLFKKPKQIAILVPGFQLDGSSLLAIRDAFNNRNIPALFPESFPHGIDAVLCRQHPQFFVKKIVDYIKELQKQYNPAEILLFGHSFGGTQVLHAANELSDKRIIPITFSGLLAPVGNMAYALHALYYRYPAQVFSGDDPNEFILKAQMYQRGVNETGERIESLENHFAIVIPGDRYLTLKTQAGVYHDDMNGPHVLQIPGETPRHYREGRSHVFARDTVGALLERLIYIKKTTE